MKILSKLSNFFLRRNNTNLEENLFGYIKKFVGKQRASRGVLELKPYVSGSKKAPNSVFQNGTITNTQTLTQVENLVNQTGKEYGQSFSMSATRNLLKIKYKKAKTIEEAKEYAEKVLGIKTFDIPDLEIANQVNLSITNAIKKSRGKIHIPDKVEFSSITSDCGKYSSLECPAETLIAEKTNEITLKINRDYYNNIDKKISEYINHFGKNGQLSVNSKGRDCINLISSYKYDATLNRYFRLWKQGKLTKKAKLDFDNLLHHAREEENALLMTKDSLINYIKKSLGVNLNNLSQEEYIKKTTETLLKMRKEQKIVLGANAYQTRNAIGLDGQILHELGHVTHFRKTPFSDLEQVLKTEFTNPTDFATALKVSRYATESEGEFIGEYIKGILSGDKYTDDVTKLFERCYKGRFTNPNTQFAKLA